MSVNKTFNSTTKTISMVFLGLLALFMLASPVAAEDLIIKSTLGSSISMSLQPKIVTFPLVVGTNELNDVSAVSVTSNVPFQLYAKAGTGTSPRMKKFDGNSAWIEQSLTNPIKVGVTGSGFTTLTETNQPIFSSPAGIASTQLKLSQDVTFADVPTSGSEVYQNTISVCAQVNA